jgi:CRP-like cAMP-binding protein
MNNNLDFSNLSEDQYFAKPFFEFVLQDCPLSNSDMSLIAKHSKLVSFEKGDLLQSTATESNYIYFILSGEAISYFNDYNGKTTIWFFHFNKPESSVKNIFAVDYKSFLSGAPSTISIEALSKLDAIRFSKKDIKIIKQESSFFKNWINLINERVLIMVYDRLSTLLTLSATERYQNLLKEEPYLLNMFTSYHIASYIGIAPQSLSRIKKNT